MVVRWVGGFYVLKMFHAGRKWVARKRTERSERQNDCVQRESPRLHARSIDQVKTHHIDIKLAVFIHCAGRMPSHVPVIPEYL